jgi:hypothetical protein
MTYAPRIYLPHLTHKKTAQLPGFFFTKREASGHDTAPRAVNKQLDLMTTAEKEASAKKVERDGW